jgi:hypothetical protein
MFPLCLAPTLVMSQGLGHNTNPQVHNLPSTIVVVTIFYSSLLLQANFIIVFLHLSSLSTILEKKPRKYKSITLALPIATTISCNIFSIYSNEIIPQSTVNCRY